MTGALGWFGRLVLLVLSLMATLSIIGSIAAIPSGSVEGRLGMVRRPSAPQAQPIERDQVSQPSLRSEPRSVRPQVGVARPAEVVGDALKEPSALRWLEPLTYAVIALAGLMAIAVLFLWQAVAALNRIEQR